MERRSHAHAKLNVSLKVLAREESGYHSIETILLRLRLADDVIVRSGGDEISLRVSGDPSVPTDERNLCWQAAHILGAGGSGAGVHIELKKRIPTAAGLGGGSADAAAVLDALNAMREVPLSEEELFRSAGELGSDVPFGLCGSDMAFAWERGRRLMPLSPPPPRPVLILAPDFPIRAAEAYEWLEEDRRSGAIGPPPAARLPGLDSLGDWAALAEIAGNDLEAPVLARRPELVSLRDMLVEAGADISILCGSGPCMAGVFADDGGCDAAAERAADLGGVTPIRTRTLGPEAPLPG
jgi:4-diphosphocytidyl-2-C-methyl-D-erythritol kinase